nr:MAG TPA: hypothetical protein [Caudoviricetes sp.]
MISLLKSSHKKRSHQLNIDDTFLYFFLTT